MQYARQNFAASHDDGTRFLQRALDRRAKFFVVLNYSPLAFPANIFCFVYAITRVLFLLLLLYVSLMGTRCADFFFTSHKRRAAPLLLLLLRCMYACVCGHVFFFRGKSNQTYPSRTGKLRRVRDTDLSFGVLQPVAARGHVRSEVS